MKKIYTIIGSLAIAFAANAQNSARTSNNAVQLNNVAPVTAGQIANSVNTSTNTLLVPASFNDANCQAEIGFYTAGTYGYPAGTNSYGDNIKAQKYSLTTYSLTTPATVLGVQAIMQGIGTGSITAEIYSDVAGVPGTLLGTSQPCDISTINTNSYTAVFIFASPVVLTGTDFYVAVNFDALSTAGTGTVAVASTNTCTTNGSGAWENWLNSDGLWYSFADPNNWDWTTDLGIFPYVTADMVTGVKTTNALSTVALYPNPTTGILNVISTEVNSSVEVYNVIGTNVFSKSQLVKGNNAIDLTNLAAGSYIVKVKSGNEMTTKRIVISK